jgi:uncharacterized protein YndB with AHSA1/START domain
MLIREEVDTRATPERAWELIRDPWLHVRWNPRILETEVLSSGAPAVGFRYRVTYELANHRDPFDAEIVEFVPGERWAVRLEERLKGDGRNFQRYMIESYTIAAQGDVTHVTHEVRIHHPGVNPLLRFFIWIVMRYGRPVDGTFMDRFRELAEGETRKAA